jgi:hypothetical protein
VSKRADSVYRSGLSRRWLKTKCWTESEFLMIGVEIDGGGFRSPSSHASRRMELRLPAARSSLCENPSEIGCIAVLRGSRASAL